MKGKHIIRIKRQYAALVTVSVAGTRPSNSDLKEDAFVSQSEGTVYHIRESMAGA